MTSLFPLLPAFLDLAGRSAVLLAADAPSARFAQRLLAAGASTVLIDPAPSPAALNLAPVRLLRRRWRPRDTRRAALVVAGPDEPRLKRAQLAAKAANAIFLALGDVRISDVTLGQGEARGPLTVALAAPGLPAALNRALMGRLEEAAPSRLAGFFEAAALSGARAEDSAFWQATLNAALEAAPADWPAWLAARL